LLKHINFCHLDTVEFTGAPYSIVPWPTPPLPYSRMN
jgi:hypothetical protein